MNHRRTFTGPIFDFIVHESNKNMIKIVHFFILATATGRRLYVQQGSNGTIEHLKYENFENITWEIRPYCHVARIFTEYFDTEDSNDYVKINNCSYSGVTNFSIVISTPFDVSFTSDASRTRSGFILSWSCENGTYS